MIRNPNVEPETINAEKLPEETATPKKKNNAILLTAIALLPEIISVIKD